MISKNRFDVFLTDSEEETDEVVIKVITNKAKLINYQKFQPCVNGCCMSSDFYYNCWDGKNPRFFTKTFEKFFDLIISSVAETPVEKLNILSACQFRSFFPKVEGKYYPSFRKHDISSGKKNLFVTYSTWLNHELDSKYDLLITTCDPVCDPTLEEMKAILRTAQTDYNFYKDLVEEKQVIEMETIIRNFYDDYLKVLASRFKFFNNFQRLRDYVFYHQSRINKITG